MSSQPEHQLSEVSQETLPPDQRITSLMQQLGVESLAGFTRAEPPENSPNQQLRADLKSAIVGQDDAIDSLITALDREAFRDPTKPYCSLLFLGPTGSGKTETVRELDHFLHGDNSKLTRIDCSDYQHAHQTINLTGAPPSYVGREQVSPLAPEKIQGDKRIVLFDEVEKASPALLKLMLQILEEAQLKSQNTGRVSHFNNCIIVFTSNVGAREMAEILAQKSTGFGTRATDGTGNIAARTKRAVTEAVKDAFAPEFINRLDGQVVFDPLSDEQLGQVVDGYVSKVNARRFEHKGIQLYLTGELIRGLVQSDPERSIYNGRRIVKTVENTVISRLSEYVTAGSIPRGSKVYAVLAPQESGAEGLEYEFYTVADDELKDRYEQSQRPEVVPAKKPIRFDVLNNPVLKRKARSLVTGGGWVDWGH